MAQILPVPPDPASPVAAYVAAYADTDVQDVTGSTGQLRPHPAAAILAGVETRLATWVRLLQLTPDDRAGLGLANARTRTTLDDLRDRADARRARSVAP